MSPAPDPRPTGPAAPTSLFRCGACGRTMACSADDVARFARGRWPRCSGEVMGYFEPAERPGPDDTRVDHPPLPPGR